MKNKKEYKIKGHKGTWYIIDYSYHNGEKVYLMEHCYYSDESPNIIVRLENDIPIIILEDVYNGFSDLDEM